MPLPNPPLAALAVQLLTQVSRLLSTCPDESVNAAMAPGGTLPLVQVNLACFAGCLLAELYADTVCLM